MGKFSHKKERYTIPHTSLKTSMKLSKNCQITLSIFFFMLLFTRFTVDILQFMHSAHSSRECSLFRREKSCSSLGVIFAFSLIKSISDFTKSGILNIAPTSFSSSGQFPYYFRSSYFVSVSFWYLPLLIISIMLSTCSGVMSELITFP